MENICKKIKDIHCQFPTECHIIGNGELQHELAQNSFCITVNNSLNRNLRTNTIINIVKSKYSIKDIDFNIINLIPYDLIEDFKKLHKISSSNIIILEEEDLIDSSLILNPAIFSIKIAKGLGCERLYIDGYNFDSSTNKLSINTEDFNKVYFEKQKEEFNKFIKEQNIEFYTKKEKSIKSLIDEKVNNNEVIIVAEITNNHLGDIDLLCKIAKLATEQGADLVKIQKRDVNLFYTKEELQRPYESKFGKTYGDYRRGVELTVDDLKKFDSFCKKENILWFSTILDKFSFNLMNSTFNLELVKIPSTVSNHKNFIEYVSKNYHKDIIISTGATGEEYISEIVDKFYSEKRFLFILHTLSSYPTPLEEINTGVINILFALKSRMKNIVPGYSGHDLGSIGSMMAIAAGAIMIEKHVKYKDHEWVHFDEVALDLSKEELKTFVSEVKKAEIMRGSFKKKIHSIENHKYKTNSLCN